MRCISPVYVRKTAMSVPCGKCNFCLQTRRMDWSFRLYQEYKHSTTSIFLTLTYADPSKEMGSLCKSDLQKFFKRLRKRNAEKVSQQVRYYAVGEYGSQTERPHYHAIIFNLHPEVINHLPGAWSIDNKLIGNIHVGDVTPESISYTTKYVINKNNKYPGRDPPFAVMSRRPGIGVSYVKTHMKWHRAGEPVALNADTTFMRNFTNVEGRLGRLPRYYKNRFFTPRELQLLNEEAQRIADAKFLEQIEYLSEHHDNPYDLYNQEIWFAHEQIKSKSQNENLRSCPI